MFESFLTVIGSLAAKKQVVGAWLILLTMGLATVGDKVYIERTKELAVIETKLDQIQKTLDKMDITLDANRRDLQTVLVEQAKVRVELELRDKPKRK